MKKALATILLCTGCATVFRGTKQGVWFTTDPPGATVKVAGVEGTTPCMLPFKRGGKPHLTTISLEGYQTAQVELTPEFEGDKLAAELLVSWFGILIDLANGAFWEYPHGLQLALSKEGPPLVTVIREIPLTPHEEEQRQRRLEMRARGLSQWD